MPFSRNRAPSAAPSQHYLALPGNNVACRNKRTQVAWEYVTDYGALWRGVAATPAGSSKPAKLSFIGLPGVASNSPPRLVVNSCCSFS